MAKLRRAARLQPCSLRLPNCSADPATTVLAHLPCVDKGTGLKGPDHFAVFACASCHRLIDGPRKHGKSYGIGKTVVPRELVLERMLAGLFETQKAFIKMGLIKVE